MNQVIYGPLQIREVFHLEFLRWFARKVEPDRYALKGGVNLRFFFRSIRYSEDMDIDIAGPAAGRIRKIVMETLSANGFADNLRSFGIAGIVPPDLAKAKQTLTTQRFKVHLLTSAGEDLFTKIEFSRRGSEDSRVVESVSPGILRAYKMAPFFVPHYGAASAAGQKIRALAQRSALQARDIFDLFWLSSQCGQEERAGIEVNPAVIRSAHDRVFAAKHSLFRDTVVAYLGLEDQKSYSSPAVWDEIRLKTAQFIGECAK